MYEAEQATSALIVPLFCFCAGLTISLFIISIFVNCGLLGKSGNKIEFSASLKSSVSGSANKNLKVASIEGSTNLYKSLD